MLRKPSPNSQRGYQPLPGQPEQGDKQGNPQADGSSHSDTARPPPPPPLPGQQQLAGLARRNSTGTGLRKISPGPEHTRRHLDRPLDRNAKVNQPTVTRTVAPGQPAPPQRSKEKFVSLPEELDNDIEAQLSIPLRSQSIFEDLESTPALPTTRGRIAIYCTAEGFDRQGLQVALQEKGPNWLLHKYPDCLYGKYASDAEPEGDVFYFDYGCVAFWGLKVKQEQEVLRALVKPFQHSTLEHRELENDEFQFHYTASERPHIQNDTITINHRFAHDHLLKLSISHALSQSTKLCVFEERVLEIVQSTRDLPERLASSGKVELSRKEIAQLIGKVFLQKAAVNLLSTVLDTPEFFWSAPDSMQTLYKKVCEYMELEERVEVLNNRFQVLQSMLRLAASLQKASHTATNDWVVVMLVLITGVLTLFQFLGILGFIGKGALHPDDPHVLQEMLDMLRDHRNTEHSAHLEWIVIWLIVVEVIVGLFECASILGWVGHE